MTNNNYSIRNLTLADTDHILELEGIIYPPGFEEDRKSIKKCLETNKYNIGIYNVDIIIGFIISEIDDTENHLVWLYDIAIHPDWQGKGLASILLSAYFKLTLSDNLIIKLLCRSTSYPIFSNEIRMNHYGYTIAENIYEKDGYFRRCGVHEDAHMIKLVPAKRSSKSCRQTRPELT